MNRRSRACEPSYRRAMDTFLKPWTSAPVWSASDAALRIAIYLSADAAISPSTRPHPITRRAVDVPDGHAMVTVREIEKCLGYSRQSARNALLDLLEIGFIESTDQRFVYRVNARPAPPRGRY